MSETEDLFSYGEQQGLCKLEILLVLQDVVLEHGLWEKAKKALDQRCEENNEYFFESFCQDCGVPKEQAPLKDFTNPDGTVKLCGECHARASEG